MVGMAKTWYRRPKRLSVGKRRKRTVQIRYGGNTCKLASSTLSVESVLPRGFIDCSAAISYYSGSVSETGTRSSLTDNKPVVVHKLVAELDMLLLTGEHRVHLNKLR